MMNTSAQRIFQTTFMILFLAVVSSCASTKITSVWMDKNKTGTSYNNILVIGISNESHNRRLFESHFAEQLNAAGVSGTVSYTILPDANKIDRETVSAAIKGKNIDAVIVSHLLAVEEKTVYRESMSYRPTYSHYNGLYDYYPYVIGNVYQPGYYTTHEIVRLETNLYEVASEELVWTAQSKTFAPESAEEVIGDLVKLVIKDLKEKGLIKAK
jgi:hypothetical protein